MSKRDEKPNKFNDEPAEQDSHDLGTENDSVEHVGTDFGNKPDFNVTHVARWDVPQAVEVVTEASDAKLNPLKVKAINLNIINDKMLVYNVDDPSEVWWAPRDKVVQTLREQVVSGNDSKTWEKPYNWDSEIDAIVVTANELRLGLYYLGYYDKSELNIRQILKDLISRGFLPVKKENK